MQDDRAPLLLAKLAEGPLATQFGEFQITAYHDGLEEAIVLSVGDLRDATDLLCRIHSECISAHVFHGYECDCYDQMDESQRLIMNEGQGVIIFLRQEGRGHGAAAHIATLPLKRQGVLQHDAYANIGVPGDRRSFSLAGRILQHLGVKSVRLISANSKKQADIQQFEIAVTSMVHYSGPVVYLGKRATDLVANIKAKIAQSPLPCISDKRRILIVGDLNVDYVLSPKDIQLGDIIDKTPPLIGGTGYGAAIAFKESSQSYTPVIFGGIGSDSNGRLILDRLKQNEMPSLIHVHDEFASLPTGSCLIFYAPDADRGTRQDRILIQDAASANSYDIDDLSQALNIAELTKDDAVLFIAHPFARIGPDHGKAMLEAFKRFTKKIILDVVPHDIYSRVDSNVFRQAINGNIHGLIGEYNTLRRLSGLPPTTDDPNESSMVKIAESFQVPFIELRHGNGNISKRTVMRVDVTNGNHQCILISEPTGYDELSVDNRRGFGDKLTVNFIDSFI